MGKNIGELLEYWDAVFPGRDVRGALADWGKTDPEGLGEWVRERASCATWMPTSDPAALERCHAHTVRVLESALLGRKPRGRPRKVDSPSRALISCRQRASATDCVTSLTAN